MVKTNKKMDLQFPFKIIATDNKYITYILSQLKNGKIISKKDVFPVTITQQQIRHLGKNIFLILDY